MNLSNDLYKNKYLKYKFKYLKLKQQLELNQIGNGMLDSFSKMIGSMGLKTIGSMSSMGLMSMGISKGFGNSSMLTSALPFNQQQSLKELEQFITPENIQLFSKLVVSMLSHLLDPTFYPLLVLLIKDITMLLGSIETAAIPAILFSLNNTLGQLKKTFPKEFKLLKEFFISNRYKIIPIIQKYSGMVNITTYTFLIDFIFN